MNKLSLAILQLIIIQAGAANFRDRSPMTTLLGARWCT